MERASVTRRFFAYVIDYIVLYMLGFAYGLMRSFSSNEPTQTWALSGIIELAIPAAYFIWYYATSGQTLGKRALGIKVVSMDGSPLNWRKGVLRSVGYILSSIPFGLGFLWAIWDRDKQAGHDKIAGTCVVPASVEQEQFQGNIEPEEIKRTQKRWLLLMGVTAGIIGAVFFFFTFSVIGTALTEVSNMGPWPSAEISPQALISVDLSQFGLVMDQVKNARDSGAWSNGKYHEGVLIIYESEEQRVLANVWALQYQTKQAASNDFSSNIAWVEGAGCGRYSWGMSNGVGLITCQFTDGTNKIFLNDYWILDILAMEGGKFTPDILVDHVRDAIAAHWRTFNIPSL